MDQSLVLGCCCWEHLQLPPPGPISVLFLTNQAGFRPSLQLSVGGPGLLCGVPPGSLLVPMLFVVCLSLSVHLKLLLPLR